MIGASERGTSHIASGRPCEDAIDSRVRPDGILIVAVADGAGSASNAELGATFATMQAVECMDHLLDHAGAEPILHCAEDLMRETFAFARERLLWASAEFGLPLGSLASTLILVIAGDAQTAIGQVGDGGVVAQLLDGGIFALTKPDRGEFLNETTFLTSDKALDDLKYTKSPETLQQLAVMTDGVQSVAFDLATDEPFIPFFETLFRFGSSATDSAALSEFLRSERLAARTDDDKTIVLACRR